MSEMPRKPILISDLENYFQDFIDFKRSTGLKYISEVKVLKYFARYCHFRDNGRMGEIYVLTGLYANADTGYPLPS